MEIAGILHAHSTYSYDAKLTLSELRDLCIRKGVQFVCMTEHVDELTKERADAFVKECELLSDDRFRFIPGFEVPYKSAHVLMIGTREFLGNYAPTITELLQWTERASFVVLAHPVRNHFAVDDGLLGAIDALEVWNQQYEGKRVPRTRSLKLLEVLREKKETLLATGGVDFHRSEHFGAPLITLDVHEFTESAILEKLKTGAFVVSSEQSTFFGTLPNTVELIAKHRWESLTSVSVIVLGKFVNRILAVCGLSLPKGLKQLVRKRL
jgi:predicted metal-dependent phosphoesterase TrpH